MKQFPTLGALVLSLALSPSAFAGYSLRGTGGSTDPSVSSVVTGVSADGALAVGAVNFNGTMKATLWSAGTGHVVLGDLPGGTVISTGQGISADGDVVVGVAGSSNGFEAYRWTPSTGMIGLGELPGTGVFSSTARDVSADGNVVVGISQRTNPANASYRAFRWTAATGMVEIPDLAGGEKFAIANSVSANGGVIVGQSVSATGDEAFRWTAGTGTVGLGDLPGGPYSSVAHAVTPDGNVIVGAASGTNGREAFRWTATTGMVGIGALPPRAGDLRSAQANAVSADGNVIVGLGAGPGDASDGRAFVWFPAGMRDLGDYLVQHGVAAASSWNLTEATGISADGKTIVGMGVNPQGAVEGWVVTIDIDNTPPPPPPPPPSDVTETFGPSAVSVQAGTLVSGGVSQLQASDNADLSLRATAKSAMQLTIDGVASRATASQLSVAIESAAQGSSTQQAVALFNFSTSTWETLNTRTLATADTSVVVTVTSNAARFIQAGTKAVRVRLIFTPSGGKKDTTNVQVDLSNWTRMP